MRQYRGLTKEGRWVYGWYCQMNGLLTGEKGKHYILSADEGEIKLNARFRCEIKGLFVVIPETVGQSTGLFDKNGKEIFEGDILEKRFDHAPQTVWLRGEVRYSNGAFRIHAYVLCQVSEACKIIGNIHENKELLNETPNG